MKLVINNRLWILILNCGFVSSVNQTDQINILLSLTNAIVTGSRKINPFSSKCKTVLLNFPHCSKVNDTFVVTSS